MTALALTSSAVLTAGTPAAGTAKLTDSATFTNPNTSARDNIVDHLVGLIGHADKGSMISVAQYHLNEPRVRKALAAAYDDHVRVHVVLSAAEKHSAEAQKLKKKFAEHPERDSWVKFCPKRGKSESCIGTHIMHNKFFLFTKTEGAEAVIVQSSANLNEHSGTAMWNSAVTLVGHRGLFAAYTRYFDDLTTFRQNPNYFFGPGHSYRDSEFGLWHSPRLDLFGNPWVDILNKVKCTGNHSGGTSDGRTIIRVANHMIKGDNGVAIAKALWDKDNEGCYVDIVSTDIRHKKHPGDKMQPLEVLLKKPKSKPHDYHGPVVRDFSAWTYKKDGHRGPERKQLHQKDMMIDGWYGHADNKVVVTGTLNFTNTSNSENDETLLLIDDDKLHDAFVKQFLKVRKCANLDWQTSGQQNGDAPDHDPSCV